MEQKEKELQPQTRAYTVEEIATATRRLRGTNS